MKKKGDAAKTAVRNIRRDGNDAFKKSNKAKEISEDEYAELQEKLQKITDKYVAMVDKAVETKTKEIMTVLTGRMTARYQSLLTGHKLSL